MIRGSSFCSSLLCVFCTRKQARETFAPFRPEVCMWLCEPGDGWTRARKPAARLRARVGREETDRRADGHRQSRLSIQQDPIPINARTYAPAAHPPPRLPSFLSACLPRLWALLLWLLLLLSVSNDRPSNRPTIDHRALARRSSACVYLSMYVWVVSHSNATHCMHGWGPSCIDRSIINAHMHARNTSAAHTRTRTRRQMTTAASSVSQSVKN